MSEQLTDLVKRLFDQGHAPQSIYDALVKRVAPKKVRQVVYEVTDVHIRRRSLSAKSIAKISASCTGRIMSDETRAKISAARLGQKPSPQTIAKRATARKRKKLKRKKLTLTTRTRISRGLRAAAERRTQS